MRKTHVRRRDWRGSTTVVMTLLLASLLCIPACGETEKPSDTPAETEPVVPKEPDTIIRCPLSTGETVEFEFCWDDHREVMNQLFDDLGKSLIRPQIVRKKDGREMMKIGDMFHALKDEARLALCRKILSNPEGDWGPGSGRQSR